MFIHRQDLLHFVRCVNLGSDDLQRAGCGGTQRGLAQFDSPSTSSEHYTYADDIRIEPSSGRGYEDEQPVTV
jgi:hypothetical protein